MAGIEGHRICGDNRNEGNHMEAGFIILLIVVGALALAMWPICVLLSRRRPYREEKLRDLEAHMRADRRFGEPESAHGTVTGGSHVGGGRSVAPRRDEAVVPEQGGVVED